MGDLVAYATVSAVCGDCGGVLDGTLTLAGLRGSRPAQLIQRIDALY